MFTLQSAYCQTCRCTGCNSVILITVQVYDANGLLIEQQPVLLYFSAMKLKESGEMYLETILILSKSLEHVRAIDVAEKMGYSKPSVSRGLSILRNARYINTDMNGYLTLTQTGMEIAEKIYERHQVITGLLESIGVEHKIAEEDACRVEHVISDATFNAIRNSIR